MSPGIPPTLEVDDSALGECAPVTLISTPWIRLVSTDRIPASDRVPVPDACGRAA